MTTATHAIESARTLPADGPSSREALRAVLGDEAFNLAEQEGRNAPDPSPQLVETVRRVLAPTLRAMHVRT